MKKNLSFNERKKKILLLVVKHHIEYAEPVSSLVLNKKYNFQVSPATIRNELANLEEEGFLTHPHTSAGRTPTDKGYRFYVDNLMRMYKLSEQEKKEIEYNYKDLKKNVNSLVRNTLQTLTSVLNYVGIFAEKKKLMNLLFGNIKEDLQNIYSNEDQFYYSGLSHLLEEPEFGKTQQIRGLLNIFENQDKACNILSGDDSSSKIKIKIGEENKCPDLKDYSIITKTVQHKGESMGTIGIVGPKRMRYAQSASALNCVADNIDQLLTRL
jgi:heat-inducible transcriptional repressor